MEIDKGRTPEPLSPLVRYVLGRIERRTGRVRANQNATPEQIQEVEILATLTEVTLGLGNPLTLEYGKRLIDLSDSLMIPEEKLEEQKPEEG
jgi:hypothetical protein